MWLILQVVASSYQGSDNLDVTPKMAQYIPKI